MASNSLLECYVYVVYENKKIIEQTFSKNIFSTDQNFQISKKCFFLFKSMVPNHRSIGENPPRSGDFLKLNTNVIDFKVT